MAKSFTAAAKIEAYRFIKNVGSNSVEKAATSKDNIFGISTVTNTVPGDVLDCFLNGEIAEIEYGENVSAGDYLTSDSDGCAIKAADGDNIGAIAFDAGVKGDIVQVQVVLCKGTKIKKTDEETESTTVQGGN